MDNADPGRASDAEAEAARVREFEEYVHTQRLAHGVQIIAAGDHAWWEFLRSRMVRATPPAEFMAVIPGMTLKSLLEMHIDRVERLHDRLHMSGRVEWGWRATLALAEARHALRPAEAASDPDEFRRLAAQRERVIQAALLALLAFKGDVEDRT